MPTRQPHLRTVTPHTPDGKAARQGRVPLGTAPDVGVRGGSRRPRFPGPRGWFTAARRVGRAEGGCKTHRVASAPESPCAQKPRRVGSPVLHGYAPGFCAHASGERLEGGREGGEGEARGAQPGQRSTRAAGVDVKSLTSKRKTTPFAGAELLRRFPPFGPRYCDYRHNTNGTKRHFAQNTGTWQYCAGYTSTFSRHSGTARGTQKRVMAPARMRHKECHSVPQAPQPWPCSMAMRRPCHGRARRPCATSPPHASVPCAGCVAWRSTA